jgi:hypothetical protein
VAQFCRSQLAGEGSQTNMQSQADCSREQAPSHMLSAGRTPFGRSNKLCRSQLAGEEGGTDTVYVLSKTNLATKVAPTMICAPIENAERKRRV